MKLNINKLQYGGYFSAVENPAYKGFRDSSTAESSSKKESKQESAIELLSEDTIKKLEQGALSSDYSYIADKFMELNT